MNNKKPDFIDCFEELIDLWNKTVDIANDKNSTEDEYINALTDTEIQLDKTFKRYLEDWIDTDIACQTETWDYIIDNITNDIEEINQLNEIYKEKRKEKRLNKIKEI